MIIKNKRIRILLITNGLILLSSAMLGPLYAFFVEELGGSFLEAGLAGAAFAFSAAITTIISGRISDKLKEREFMVILGYSLIGTGFLLFIFVENISGLILVQILLGLGEAIYSPTFDALYSKYVDKGKDATEWGLWEGMNYSTIGIGALFGGIFVNSYGFHAIFAVMGLLSLFSAFYLFMLPRKLL